VPPTLARLVWTASQCIPTQPQQLIAQNAQKGQPYGPHRPTSAVTVLLMVKIVRSAQLVICISAQETKYVSPVELWFLTVVSVIPLGRVVVAIMGFILPMLPLALLVLPIVSFARMGVAV
jgi:hypothetical protein